MGVCERVSAIWDLCVCYRQSYFSLFVVQVFLAKQAASNTKLCWLLSNVCLSVSCYCWSLFSFFSLALFLFICVPFTDWTVPSHDTLYGPVISMIHLPSLQASVDFSRYLLLFLAFAEIFRIFVREYRPILRTSYN